MRNLLFLLFSLITIFPSQAQDNWTKLLDKDLTHWNSYLSFKHQPGYNGKAPKDKDGNLIAPIGLNHDEYKVFTVIDKNNELVLKISGEVYGCLFTKEEYANYDLKLKVKWGDKKWAPRKDLLKDAGILYHSIGPLGAEYWRTWMLSQEFQIMEGHMGDYWSQVTSAIDIKAFIPESTMNPLADKGQPFISMGSGEKIHGFCLRSANYENTEGEWNTLELICFENKSLHIVNGHVVMVLENSRYVQNGEKIPLTKGKIQLQSEAAEVFFKDIEIRHLKSLPAKYLQYYAEPENKKQQE
jgi:hypothetical protein